MSKDDKKLTETVTLDISDSIWTKEDSAKVLQEINFDSWDANGSPITVTTDSPISTHGMDTITIDASSNGIKQGDLFLGWPEGDDVVTVTLDDIKTED